MIPKKKTFSKVLIKEQEHRVKAGINIKLLATQTIRKGKSVRK